MIGFTFGGQAGGQGPHGLQGFMLQGEGQGLLGTQHMDGHGLHGGGQQGSHEGIGQQLGSQEISQHIIGGQHGSHISAKEGNGMLITAYGSVFGPYFGFFGFLNFFLHF